MFVAVEPAIFAKVIVWVSGDELRTPCPLGLKSTARC
jgi:hypothetical protein